MKTNKCVTLGKSFPGIYFTCREAECAKSLLQGDSIEDIANKLGLTNFTIEFYLKNMRAKLHCKNNKALVKKIKESDFPFSEE